MPTSAKQTVDITSLIKGILNGYPGNSAIFREYLQNSDDAKAKTQVFVLDERRHPTTSVIDPALQDTQGPALIAFNDQMLAERDWRALREIHSSSKGTDETQTGKNGLGFRSSYHLTENPQIISGRRLVILDPHNEFQGDLAGGCQIDVVDEGSQYADQLASFSAVIQRPYEEFVGTVFRLPLRTQAQANRSRIKTTPTTVTEMRELLISFCQAELAEVALFLKHINVIEVRSATDAGVELLGRVTITDQPGTNKSTRTVTVGNAPEGRTTTQEWLFYHLNTSRQAASALLSERLGYDVADFLIVEKLTADVELALPLNRGKLPPSSGRLYTLLPIPVRTGLPVHINAVFVLTPERQSLKTIEEVGLAHSRERRLVEWNSMIFDTFVVDLWVKLLVDLVEQAFGPNIWSAWAPENQDETSYWKSLIPALLDRCIDLDLIPTMRPNGEYQYTSLSNPDLIVTPPDPMAPLESLIAMGLLVAQVPSHILQHLSDNSKMAPIQILSPETAHQGLRKLDRINTTNRSHVAAVAEYLVFSVRDPALHHLVGLPLFEQSNGEVASLSSLTMHRAFIVPSSEAENRLFPTCTQMLAWPCISPRIHSALVAAAGSAAKQVNVALISQDDIVGDLRQRFAFPGAEGDEVEHYQDQDLVLSLWSWLPSWHKSSLLLEALRAEGRDLFLLPTRSGTLRRLARRVLIGGDASQDLLSAWQHMGIFPLHSRLSDPTLLQLLQTFDIGVASLSTAYIGFIASSYDGNSIATMTDTATDHIRQSFHAALSGSYDILNVRTLLSLDESQRLSKLPVFLVRDHGIATRTKFSDVIAERVHIKIDAKLPVPHLPNPSSFVDISDSVTKALIDLVEPSAKAVHDDIFILKMAIEHWHIQPQDEREVFIMRIFDNLLKFPAPFRDSLKNLPFITVGGRTGSVAPKDVVDPGSPLAEIYRGEDGRLPIGTFGAGRYLEMMQKNSMLQTALDATMVAERMSYLVSHPNARKSALLFCFLNEGWNQDFEVATIEARGAAWMPPLLDDTGLLAPDTTRDGFKGEGQSTALCDLVWTIVPWTSHPLTSRGFRRALGWLEPIPLSILSQQLDRTIGLQFSSDRKRRLNTLVQHLSQRELSDDDIQSLRGVVQDRSWIPTTSSRVTSQTTSVSFITLVETLLPEPFWQAQHGGDVEVNHFLERMGCSKRPPLSALASEMARLYASSSLPVLGSTVRILEEIADHYITSSPLEDGFLLPGEDGLLHPLSELYYRDNKAAWMSPSLEAKHALHEEISKILATALGVPLLSTLQLDDDDDDDEDDEQMSENFVQRVTKFLKENDISFALNEWLANASDAKATQFSMVLDNDRHPQAHPVSPRLGELYDSSTLVLFNNGLFSKKDFTRIRQISVGGKGGDSNTHGRYGLGALSLYYFTDAPTIVSGDSVLILDPASQYLPPKHGQQRRTALKRNLRGFLMKFSDHLSAGYGQYGFTRETTHFAGTLFILPLRPTIFTSAGDIAHRTHTLLNGQYRDLAPDAFFFTNLTHVSANTRVNGLISQMWIANAVTIDSEPPVALRDGCSMRRMHLYRPNSSSKEDWFVATSSGTDIPIKHRRTAAGVKLDVDTPFVVDIAIRLDRPSLQGTASRINHPEEVPMHLFSALRFPEEIRLPFHINAVFSISTNRQGIVLHPPDRHTSVRERKSAFNAWILSDPIPNLYLAVLEHLVSDHENILESRLDHWYLGGHSTDSPATGIVKAAFTALLPASQHRIFRTVTRSLIPFSSALFSNPKPSVVANIFKALQHGTFVDNFQASTITRLQGATVKPANLVSLLSDQAHSQKFIIAYSSKAFDNNAIFAIAEYLEPYSQHKGGSLIPLPILLTEANAALRPIPDTTQQVVYISSSPDILQRLFPAALFLIEGYPKSFLSNIIADTRYNVQRLDSDNIPALITQRLHELKFSRSESTSEWLAQLWGSYSSLPGPPPLMLLNSAELKIIETTSTPISVGQCDPDNVVHYRALEPQWAFLQPILRALKFEILRPPAHDVVKAHIQRTFPTDLVVNVIRCLQHAKKLDFVNHLPSDQAHELADWLRKLVRITTSTTTVGWKKSQREVSYLSISGLDSLETSIMDLTMFPGALGGRKTLVEARRTKILPPSMRLEDIEPYLLPSIQVSPYSSLIADLNNSVGRGSEMSVLDVLSSLSLPRPGTDILSTMDQYKQAINALLLNNNFAGPAVPADTILLPNGRGELCPPATLFDHRVPLFQRALSSRSESSFLHPAFHQFIDYARGIKSEHSYINFRHCANVASPRLAAIDNNTAEREELLLLSTTLFEVYSLKMPTLIETNETEWAALEHFGFIRRRDIRRRGASYDIQPHVVPLPTVLPPSKMLRADLGPIAWTKRGLFFTEPSSRLLAVNPALGVPDTHEVVEHLVILTTSIAPAHPQNTTLLYDLKATYKWLNDHATNLREHLLAHFDLPIFLNVDDPDKNVWGGNWMPASSLILNLRYDFGEQKAVKRFLSQYEALLKAAGCESLVRMGRTQAAQSKAADGALTDDFMRKTFNDFNDLRLAGELTDTVLHPDGEETYDESGLRAHRSFLAATIPFFRDKYRLSGAEMGETVENLAPSVFSARAILDFVYTGQLTYDEPKTEDDETKLLTGLLELLEVSDEWGMENLKLTVQSRILDDHEFLNQFPQAINTIYESAQKAGAETLLHAIARFKKDNAPLLARLEKGALGEEESSSPIVRKPKVFFQDIR